MWTSPKAPAGTRLVRLSTALALRCGRAHAVRAWLVGLSTLSRGDAALTLRLARVCGWLKRQDLAPLGYPSFAAFLAEEVEFGDRWLRDLIRLAESPLELVKEAVCRGILPLRTARYAARQATVETEGAWLERAMLGEMPDEPLPPRLDLPPEQVLQIRAARKLARLLRGRHESVRSVDAWILERWRAGATAEELLEEARCTPPKPVHPELTWCDLPDPATEIVGPWKEPSSLDEALEQVRELQELRRVSTAVLGAAWDDVVSHRLWLEVGFASADELAKQVLGTSERSMQRHRRLGRMLDWHDVVRDELKRGTLDLDQAEIAMEAAWFEPVEPWIEVARKVTKRELRQIRIRARFDGDNTRAPFEAATSASGELLTLPPTAELEPVWIPTWLPVDPELPEAAAWLLETVQIPPQRGFGRVKERDDYVCQNPLCGRRALRNHAHHLLPRSEGGSDDFANGLCQCGSCHLRIIHTGFATIEQDREDLVWRYRGGKTVRVLGGAARLGESA